jgi:hypothetical protein
VPGSLDPVSRYKYLIVKLSARSIMDEFEIYGHLRLKYQVGRRFSESFLAGKLKQSWL